MTINDILIFLNESGELYQVDGEKNDLIDSFCPINQLKENSITWIRHSQDAPIDDLNKVKNIILMAELGEKIEGAKFPIIYVNNVHRTFFRVISQFFSEQDPECRKPRIAQTAVIETSSIGSDLYVGHHTYIGPEVVLGNHVSILNNVTIQGKVLIGDFTVIESGTIIGACGFGHYDDENGCPICVPHLGGVRIGKHVKIGANNAISRGCLADTIIEDYVKTDNLVHIAHNDHIRYGAMLTAGVVVAGSTEVGAHAWMAPGTLLNNGIHVGEGAFLGLGCVATKDVPSNKVMVGMPAKVLRDR